MKDEDLESLLRAATLSGDGPTWLRAGHALARVGRHDEAALAGRHARHAGTPCDALLDAMVPDLGDLVGRRILVYGHQRSLAFDGSGRTLYSVEDPPLAPLRGGRAVQAWNVATGVSRQIAELPGPITALATHWLDPGRLAVAFMTHGPGQERAVCNLAIVNARTGAVGPLVGHGHDGIFALALADAPTPSAAGELVLAAVEPFRFRAYRLDAKGASTDPTGSADLFGGYVSSAEGSGAFAVIRARLATEEVPPETTTIDLHDPLQKRPRAQVRPDRSLRVRDVLPCGDRVVVVWDSPGGDQDLELHGRSGDLLGRAATSRTERNTRDKCPVTAAPSGWHAAVKMGMEFAIVDLRTGKARTMDIKYAPTAFAWSPSGRTLAVGTADGIALFEAR